MNLKNKYLLRKLLKWANKKHNNFNTYNVPFNKKIKKNTCRYHYQTLNDIIHSSWDIEQNILKLVLLGHFFCLFTPLKTPKIKILNEKFCWYTCVPKMTIIWCRVPKKRSETGRIVCHFGSFFALLTPPPLMIPKIKI